MQEKDFVSYEYRTKTVKAKNLARAMDMYEAFGWEVTATAHTALDAVTLSLKRDRRQRHKQELQKLERQAESVSATLDGLERAKTLGADIFAYILGVIGALVLGGGMCLTMLIEGSVPAMAGGIILGIVGIALCAVNYPIHRGISAKKTRQLLPVIDENEEVLANVMEKGNELLAADMI